MPDLEKFVSSVDALLKRRAMISLEDAGIDRSDSMLVSACHDGQTPKEFVDWYIDKYGLEDLG